MTSMAAGTGVRAPLLKPVLTIKVPGFGACRVADFLAPDALIEPAGARVRKVDDQFRRCFLPMVLEAAQSALALPAEEFQIVELVRDDVPDHDIVAQLGAAAVRHTHPMHVHAVILMQAKNELPNAARATDKRAIVFYQLDGAGVQHSVRLINRDGFDIKARLPNEPHRWKQGTLFVRRQIR